MYISAQNSAYLYAGAVAQICLCLCICTHVYIFVHISYLHTYIHNESKAYNVLAACAPIETFAGRGSARTCCCHQSWPKQVSE